MFTTNFFISCAIVAVISYLLGSFNFGIIVSHFYAKDDVRKHGSGGAGMTNMLRTYGKLPAVLTAIGDFSKAVIAIVISKFVFANAELVTSSAGYIAGLFVLLGHVFPLYFGFKGGKGVMTSLAMILVVNPVVFLIIAVIFIPIVFITKIVSIASVLGAIAFPVFTFIVNSVMGKPVLFETSCAVITGLLILFLHRENIKRLLNGTENKFGQNKK